MEISGALLRRAPVVSGAGEPLLGPSAGLAGRKARISAPPSSVSFGGFSDEGHLRYYLPTLRCGGRKKEEKKRAKLVKGLSKDLSAFYWTGFGIEAGDGVTAEVKGKMMTEAAELLLSQLKQLRAEEKELKRKRKQEKAARMKHCANDDSSSSESSDSECESVARMRNVRVADVAPIPTPAEAPVCNQAVMPLQIKPEDKIEGSRAASGSRQECCGGGGGGGGCSGSSSTVAVAVANGMDKIEVCMGGKCKRSGAVELMAEFERRVGIEGAVVGCKCMGKCRDGPNIRVLNHGKEEVSARTSRNPLCIGVGLEDVGQIVANFFGDQKDAGLLPA